MKKFAERILAVALLWSMLTTVSFADGNTITGANVEASDSSVSFSWITELVERVKTYVKSIAYLDIFDLAEEEVTSEKIELPNGVNTATLEAPEITYNTLHDIPKYTVQYQWYTCSDANGSDMQLIEKENGATLTVTLADGAEVYYACRATLYRKFVFSQVRTDKISLRYYAIHQPDTGLPTIYVNTASGTQVASKEDWEEAEITISGCDNEKYNLSTTDITIKGRGNSSWKAPKKSYSIKFDKKQNLFGAGKDKKWALIANYYDKTLMRNWFVHELDTKVFDGNGEYNITQIPVDLYFNGEYMGNYYLSTTIKLGDNRIDIPDISDEIEEDINGDGEIDYYDGGFLIEIDARADASYWFKGTYSKATFCLSDPDLDEENENNEAIFNHIKNVVQTAEDVLYSENFTDPETGYARYIDADSFIDYILMQEIAKNNDSNFFLSNHMYYDPSDGLIHMAPVWDFDIAFGNIDYGSCDDYTGLRKGGGWFGRLMEDPAFTQKLVDRWNETKSLVSEMVNNDIQQQADKLSLSAKLNFEKWNVLGKFIWYSPAGYEDRTTYQSEVDYFIHWTNNRIACLDEEYNALLN